MKSKRKHFFGILLSLVMMFTIMSVPGMIQTVYGEEGLYMTELELPEYWVDDQNPLTEDDLTGFKTCTLEEAKAWTEVPSGNIALLYSHSGNEWAYVYFEDGKYKDEGSRSITKGEIKAQSEYYSIYYTSVALYPLWIDGVMVTGANADNVLPGGDNDGKVSFTPATDDTPATLTLNGANIRSGAHDGAGIYYADANNELVIDATTASTVTGPNYGDNSYGILSDGDLTINGELTAKGGDNNPVVCSYGIYGKKALTINEEAEVTARGGLPLGPSYGISVATLTVNGTLSANVSLENNCIGAQTTNITVGERGALTAGGAIGIRNAGGSITVNGILNAKGTGSEEHSALLSTGEGSITVNKGAQLTANGVVCGINAGSNSIIINEGAQLTATGGTTGAITGTVKNAIAGTGWTDTAGTQGKAEIAVSETGQNLPSSYKKVQFPAKVDPKPTPKPTPKKPQTVGKTTIRNTIANSSKKSNDVIYDAVPGATGYDIAYKHKNSSKWIIKNVGKKTRATVSGFSVKGIYQFKVRAKKAETSKYKAATGSWSTVIYRYFHTTEKIRLKSASKGSFTMSWKKNPQATGYQVMFSTNKNGAGAAKNINTVGKNATSFTKTGLKSGRTYYVQVREIVKIGGVNYIGNISRPVPVKIR